MDSLVDRAGPLSVWFLAPEQLIDFSAQVYSIYDDVYSAKHGWRSSINDLKDLYSEDLRYSRQSTFIVIKFGSQVLCTGRMTVKQFDTRFPLEQDFDVNVHAVLEQHKLQPHEIWHCGRASMNKELLRRLGLPKSFSVSVFKALLYYAFLFMGKDASNVVFAESDKATHRIYASMGMKWRKLSEEKQDYLGSPTFATMIPVDEVFAVPWFRDFDLQTCLANEVPHE